MNITAKRSNNILRHVASLQKEKEKNKNLKM